MVSSAGPAACALTRRLSESAERAAMDGAATGLSVGPFGATIASCSIMPTSVTRGASGLTPSKPDECPRKGPQEARAVEGPVEFLCRCSPGPAGHDPPQG